ncbi:peptide-methionine (S)-S-oxide reductase MsrA [Arachidicoccus sp.]|uniref:peptide-methionine (S)-S-oxide reductase MsrA n=1 Tax=Arachidicoccus sp. TaxID=1872624 RepID=UPI003D21B260
MGSKLLLWTSAILCFASFTSCVEQKNHQRSNVDEQFADKNLEMENIDTATFGTGCFWCTEAFFQRLKGVVKVISGYSGGNTPNPTYEEVCSGTTGYAEACQIMYDPSVISFEELLKVFWQTHDPTTLNRQGNDVGTQYRSVIFYHNQQQMDEAQHYKEALQKSGAWDKPIVTAIEPYKSFFSAENYHQNYYNDNPRQMYCQYVIKPKLEKFEKAFKDKLK